MNPLARLSALLRTMLCLPTMTSEELAGFRESQARFRQPLVVPVVVLAVLTIWAFVGWDLARVGHWSPVATTRIVGGFGLLSVLVLVRGLLKLPLRQQVVWLYCAVYAWQLAIGQALGPQSPMQLPGLIIIMFTAILALARAGDALLNIPFALVSVPVVLSAEPDLGEVLYVIGHFVTVVGLVSMASAVLQRLFAQNYLFHTRLEHEARTDALTGLLNRREFERSIQRDLERAERLGVPLTLAVIDVDHFKSVNDAHGHQAGDVVLKEVAQRLLGTVRESDVLARLGGEEFAVVMLGTRPAEACVFLERLRAAVESLEMLAGGQSVRCTVSVGLAERARSDIGWSGLYARADAALYAAKTAGRNRVVGAPPVPPPPPTSPRPPGRQRAPTPV